MERDLKESDNFSFTIWTFWNLFLAKRAYWIFSLFPSWFPGHTRNGSLQTECISRQGRETLAQNKKGASLRPHGHSIYHGKDDLHALHERRERFSSLGNIRFFGTGFSLWKATNPRSTSGMSLRFVKMAFCGRPEARRVSVTLNRSWRVQLRKATDTAWG